MNTAYNGDTCMDLGYFIGTPDGLLWIPPLGDSRQPGIIPWSEVLDDEDGDSQNDVQIED